VQGRTFGEVEALAAGNLVLGRLSTAEDVAQVIAFLASLVPWRSMASRSTQPEACGRQSTTDIGAEGE